ncbi:unnamed protein product [Anisakis simplex]|uniref:Small cell adhesion glycoprotein n=1 Tax=Anisakis simplex TaxID=6269 RepID=A0A0M3K7T1_ANISI|nr:unnamed protein product [Anisakis simplex]
MTASTERIPSMKMIYVNTASLARPGVGSSAIAGDGSIRSTRMSNGLIGMIIISAVLAAIALILITCYLMLRYCNRPSRNTKNNAALPDFYSSADVIPYPKRIYELQAEEGE